MKDHRTRRGAPLEASRALTVILVLAALIACRPGTPVVDPSPRPPNVGGTISGKIATEAGVPVADRLLVAVNVETGERHEITTNANGQYTMKVPVGTYRLELTLASGESLVDEPGQVTINRGDLDADESFVIRVQP